MTLVISKRLAVFNNWGCLAIAPLNLQFYKNMILILNYFAFYYQRHLSLLHKILPTTRIQKDTVVLLINRKKTVSAFVCIKICNTLLIKEF
ncbi:MAG TPA: hypothetical protein TECP_00436 [Hyphomicrobiaceae bacterium MAG_BT-2024]